jgi:hypothetical protein
MHGLEDEVNFWTGQLWPQCCIPFAAMLRAGGLRREPPFLKGDTGTLPRSHRFALFAIHFEPPVIRLYLYSTGVQYI